MATERLILITSNDKNVSESSSNSDFVIYLKETYNTQNIIRVLVKDISVPNVFYNIRDGTNGSQNNEFVFLETGEVDEFIILPQGQYTTATLMSALQTAMNTVLVSGTVAITQDPLTQKIVFTFTGTTAIIYNVEDESLLSGPLGITTTTPAPSAVITADALPSLNGIEVVYIHSKEIALNRSIDGGFGLISAFEDVSFNNVPFGAYAYRQNNDDELAQFTYDQPANLSRITIVLRDDKGNVLDIGTQNMTIVLKAFY